MPHPGSGNNEIPILYVDDDPELQTALKAFLEKSEEVRVDTAGSAEAALPMLETCRYHAVVSDDLCTSSTGMDGRAFVQALRERGDRTPVLFFSERGGEEFIISAFESGVDFTLLKGDNPKSRFAELERKIRKAVALRGCEDGERRTEDEERRRAEKYQILVDRASQMLFVHDLSGAFLDVNEKSVQNTGYSREELLSMTVWDIDPDTEEHEFTEWLWKESKPYEERIFETRHQRKDGSVYPAEVHATKVILHGEPCIMALATDITDRKEAEAELRENEKTFRGIIENFQDIYYRTDLEGRVSMVSPSAARILGYDSIEEIIGVPASDFWVNPDERDEFMKRITEEGRVHDYEVLFRKRDGTTLPASVSSSCYFDDSGAFAGIEGVVRDISQRKHAEEALRQSEAEKNAIFHALPVMLAYYDTDMKVLYANQVSEDGRAEAGGAGRTALL